MTLRTRNRKGATLVEAMTALTIFSLLCFGGLTMVVSGANSYQRDFGRGTLETDVDQAMRRVVEPLRNAIGVTVATDGQSISFSYPHRDAAGQVTVPVQSDGITRTVSRSATNSGWLLLNDPANPINRPLVEDLLPAGASYRVFTMLPSNKAVVIRISASISTGRETMTVSKTECVRFRNLP